MWCRRCMRRKLEYVWRVWKYSLGAFSDEKTKEYDNIVCVVRTCIFVSILSTNMMIVAGNIRHWNDVDYTTQYKEMPRGDYR